MSILAGRKFALMSVALVAPRAGALALTPPQQRFRRPIRHRAAVIDITCAAAHAADDEAAAPLPPAAALPATLGREEARTGLSVATVLLAAFLNLLGFTMTLPLTLPLRSHFALSTGASFGSLSSAYPLGMLFALFLWPRLSDSVGRKPVISLSLLGSGLGLAAQCYAVQQRWGLRSFLLCRLLTGCCAGASPVAKAYLADLGAASGKLPQFMAWREAATTLAFIAGPLVGGKLYAATSSLASVIGMTALGSIAASALVSTLVFEDSNAADSASKPTKRMPNSNADGLIACPLGSNLVAAVVTVCFVSALYNCGSSTFAAFFAPLAHEVAGLDVQGVGFAYTCLSSISFLISVKVSAPLQRAFGTVAAAVCGLFSVGIGLIGMGLVTTASLGLSANMRTTYFWLAAMIYQVGVPLFTPTVPTMLLQCVPRQRRGTMMGIDEACNTVARVGAPIAFGTLYAKFGASACCGGAGFAVLLAALLAMFRRFVVLRAAYA